MRRQGTAQAVVNHMHHECSDGSFQTHLKYSLTMSFSFRRNNPEHNNELIKGYISPIRQVSSFLNHIFGGHYIHDCVTRPKHDTGYHHRITPVTQVTMVIIQCSPIAFAPPPFKGRRKSQMSDQKPPITPHENDILMGRGGEEANRVLSHLDK